MSYEHCHKHDEDATNGCLKCLAEHQAEHRRLLLKMLRLLGPTLDLPALTDEERWEHLERVLRQNDFVVTRDGERLWGGWS